MTTQTSTILPTDIIESLIIEGFEAAIDQTININESLIQTAHNIRKHGSAMGVFESQIAEAEQGGLTLIDDKSPSE